MDCIFCKIANKEVPKDFIFEDENFVAFLNIKPVGEGHTLVMPKKHFVDLISLNEEISCDYIKVLQEVGKILMKNYNAEGFNIILNNGKSAGQIIKHVHFHIIPRKKGDGIRMIA